MRGGKFRLGVPDHDTSTMLLLPDFLTSQSYCRSAQLYREVGFCLRLLDTSTIIDVLHLCIKSPRRSCQFRVPSLKSSVLLLGQYLSSAC